MKTKSSFATVEQRRPIGHIEVTRTVREFKPILSDPSSGFSIGARIDQMLIDAAHSSESDIQDITIHFEREEWYSLKQAILGAMETTVAIED